MTARRGRPPAGSAMPRASASRVPTPTRGRPALAASAWALAMPTRRPVNEPGPTPTAIRPTEPQPPAASAARSTSSSRRVACPGLPSAERPSRASWRTSPSRVAQTAVSSVAVSKPISARSARPGSVGDAESEGPDFLALHEPTDDVFAGDVRGDLVHVERPLDRFLFFGAEIFLGREFDANRVEDGGVVAAEEGALFAGFLADVRRFRVLRDAAGDVVAVGGGACRARRHRQQRGYRRDGGDQRLQSLHQAHFLLARSFAADATPPYANTP